MRTHSWSSRETRLLKMHRGNMRNKGRNRNNKRGLGDIKKNSCVRGLTEFREKTNITSHQYLSLFIDHKQTNHIHHLINHKLATDP